MCGEFYSWDNLIITTSDFIFKIINNNVREILCEKNRF